MPSDSERQLPVLDSVLVYARDRGWYVFPVPPGTKKSYKSARHSGGAKWGMTRDEDEIRRDWERWPSANCGVVTGKPSMIFVVEADTLAGHAVDGIASLRELEARHGPLPPTLMGRSPSGSIHYYFNHPGGEVKIKNSASEVAPGVDVRGDGGMVVAPPSARRDGAYAWLNDLPIADAPDWLIALVVARPRERTSVGNGHDADPPEIDFDKIGDALSVIPNSSSVGWEAWNRIAMAVYASTGGSQRGLALFVAWSKKSTKHDLERTEAKWLAIRTCPPTDIGVGTLYYLATEANPGWDRITLEDFWANMDEHKYIFAMTGALWPAASVDARFAPVVVVSADGEPKKIKPHVWLDQNRAIEQMTWHPGEPEIIRDKVAFSGDWVARRGATCYNLYKPPRKMAGDARRAGPWLDHVDKLLGEDGRRHVVAWMAHRVQKPGEKINHAILIGGAQGIGKDTLFEPLKFAVGHWNFNECSPQRLIGRFNKFLKSVVLRVAEARDLGDMSRYAFYEHTKTATTSPPDVLTIDEKHTGEYVIANVVSLIITTNYKQDGVFLPADDRRHYVIWCDVTREDFPDDYWPYLWGWYEAGGYGHVVDYLRTHDLSHFDPKAPPPRTSAFWDIVDANRSPESSEMADAIENLGNPSAHTIPELISRTEFSGDFDQWLTDRKNRRAIPHRLEQCGYVVVRNPDSADGVWKVNGRRTPIYAKMTLSYREQIQAARDCKERLERSNLGS